MWRFKHRKHYVLTPASFHLFITYASYFYVFTTIPYRALSEKKQKLIFDIIPAEGFATDLYQHQLRAAQHDDIMLF